MADVEPGPKRDFDFYCHLLRKISAVNFKFRNYTTSILSSVLNSRLLKSTILKVSFIFIKFRYNVLDIVLYARFYVVGASYCCFLESSFPQ